MTVDVNLQLPMRLAKFIALCGYCSRREAERLIYDGLITVNGLLINKPICCHPLNDVIAIKGKILNKELGLSLIGGRGVKIWLFHKPRKIIVTRSDPQGRPTIFSLFPSEMRNTIAVGRLDYESEGLMLLTNSGKLARQLTLPTSNLSRTYKCRFYSPSGKTIAPEQIEAANRGLTIFAQSQPITYRSVKIEVDREQDDKKNRWANVKLSEGKNREVRKIFEHFGLVVNRLIRIGYEPFNLGNLKPGQLREANYNEFNQLVNLLGP